MVDYFRAPDAATALTGGDGRPRDVVRTNGIDPHIVLGRLVRMIREDADSAGPPRHEDLGEAVYVLDDRFTQSLAEVDDLRVPEYAARWSLIREMGDHVDIGGLAYVIESLSALARRAREADERLYCRVKR